MTLELKLVLLENISNILPFGTNMNKFTGNAGDSMEIYTMLFMMETFNANIHFDQRRHFEELISFFNRLQDNLKDKFVKSVMEVFGEEN